MTVKKIEQFFVDNGLTWNFSDGRRTPTVEDIDRTIKTAIGVLENEPDKAQLEVGRLIVQNNAGYVDVYVHIAEFPREQS